MRMNRRRLAAALQRMARVVDRLGCPPLPLAPSEVLAEHATILGKKAAPSARTSSRGRAPDAAEVLAAHQKTLAEQRRRRGVNGKTR